MTRLRNGKTGRSSQLTKPRSLSWSNLRKVPAWVVALVVAAVIFAPVLVLILLSFSTSFVPGHFNPTFSNYTKALGSADTWGYLRNSVVFTIGSSPPANSACATQ